MYAAHRDRLWPARLDDYDNLDDDVARHLGHMYSA